MVRNAIPKAIPSDPSTMQHPSHLSPHPNAMMLLCALTNVAHHEQTPGAQSSRLSTLVARGGVKDQREKTIAPLIRAVVAIKGARQAAP